MFNLFDISLPGWLGGIEGAVYGTLFALLILATTLVVSWKDEWTVQVVEALPAIDSALTARAAPAYSMYIYMYIRGFS